jgi:adenylate kinase
VIINLLVDDSVVFERITGRRSCPECGAVYHIKNLKPKVDGICDNDGAELIQRTDDTLEVVKNRLKTYYEQTEPVVDYYKANKDVYEVDANGDANEVSNFIFQKLDALAETQNRMRDVQA